MQGMTDVYGPPPELVLGERLSSRVPEADQKRQRAEVEELLRRLWRQPGVVLADEVGMGKTFVALGVAYSVAVREPCRSVIVMVPPNLIDKWVQDFVAFCELYLENCRPVQRGGSTPKRRDKRVSVRYGVARHSIELLRLLDDAPERRCHLIFLAQGAMGRGQSDKWVRLALIAEALRRHGNGTNDRLVQVKKQIHRFLADLLRAVGEQRAHSWGEALWQNLLEESPERWMNVYNGSVNDERRLLGDDPVPEFVTSTLKKMDLLPLAAALTQMPVRARGGRARVQERLDDARKALRQVEEALWKNLLAQMRWRSPLLVMDEAHHLKNPATSLARQLQSPDLDQDLRTGDGALANAFNRMLFLTATPFQLGHHELVRVLERFGDVRWDRRLGDRQEFHQQLKKLSQLLDESQRTAVALQRSWNKLRPEDCRGEIDGWWEQLLDSPRAMLSSYQRAVLDAYEAAKQSRDAAESAIRPWIVRHNKGKRWAGTDTLRRERVAGKAIIGGETGQGLPIPPERLLPFFLAARSAVSHGRDLLGEALCSSYEAFRLTRQTRRAELDEQEDLPETILNLSHSHWYLSEFDRALELTSGSIHPKVAATVQRVVDLWEAGEKVLVFAFYRHTCRALRIHIAREIERRILLKGQRRLGGRRGGVDDDAIYHFLQRIRRRFFDKGDAPGRRALDAALNGIINAHFQASVKPGQLSAQQRQTLMQIMRRFLRVTSTLVRYFPLKELNSIKPAEAVARTLACVDASGVSWQHKFEGFLEFLIERCSSEERDLYLGAARIARTGRIRIETDEDEVPEKEGGILTIPNVQVVTGKTKRDARARLMRAFNTPFFPDILVCSEVMGEGVDLQRFCRHVVHHDLAWNPSTIEQRTGRIDRLGCKAESRQPIVVYMPYLAGAADERQYRVMSDREQWFRVVMGQDEVARLITSDSDGVIPLPDLISNQLSYKLGLGSRVVQR